MKKSWYLTNEYREITKEIEQAGDEWLRCQRKVTEMIFDGDITNTHFGFIEQITERAWKRMKYNYDKRERMKVYYEIPDSDTDGDDPGGKDS